MRRTLLGLLFTLIMCALRSQAQADVELLSRMGQATTTAHRLELLLGAARAQLGRGETEGAEELAHAGLEEAQRAELPVLTAQCAIILAEVDLRMGRPLSALTDALRAMTIAQGQDARLEAQACLLLARIFQEALVPAKSASYASLALASGLLTQMEDLHAHRIIATSKATVGDLDGALKEHLRSLAQSRSLKDRSSTRDALASAADLEARLLRFTEAIAHQRELVNIQRSFGSATDLGIATNNLAEILARSGDREQAVVEFFNAGRQLLGAPERGEEASMNLAVVLGQLGRYGQAQDNVDEALRSMETRETLGSAARARNLKAGLYLLEARFGDAQAQALQARTLAERTGVIEDRIAAVEILLRAARARSLFVEVQRYNADLKELQLLAERAARAHEHELEQAAYRLQEQEKDLLSMFSHEQRERLMVAQSQLVADTLRKGIDLIHYETELQRADLEHEALAHERAQQALKLAEADLYAERSEREIEQLESQRTIQSLRFTRLDLEKKQQASDLVDLERSNELLQKEKLMKATEQRRTRVIMWSSSVIAFIVLCFAVFTLWVKRKVSLKNGLIHHQMVEIERINGALSQTNTDLLGSITYARHIQSSIVPTEADLQRHLANSFIYFKPQTEVSGDLPFVHRIGDRLCVAMIDCTGHGVPAAMLSFIAYYNLQQVLIETPTASSADLLRDLYERVHRTMRARHGEEGVDDSMDMGLAIIDLSKETLDFAGVQNKALVIKADRQMILEGGLRSVGGTLWEEPTARSRVKVPLEPGDRLTLFSDGVIHQFGSNGKKFSSRRLRETLATLAGTDPHADKEAFSRQMSEWMGGTEQTDDMLMLGITYQRTIAAASAA